MPKAADRPDLLHPPEPLLSALRACKPHLTYAALFSALVNLLLLTPTFYMLQVYDRVLPTGGMATLAWMSLLALVAYGVLSFLSDMRGRITVRASLRLDRLLAPAILDRVLGARPAGSRGEGERMRAVRDLDSVRQGLTGPGLAALMDAPWTPIYILAAFMLHPAVGLLTLVASGALVGLAVLNERAVAATAQQAAEAMTSAQASQEAVARRADVVRALGMRRALAKMQLGQRALGVESQAEVSLRASRYSTIIKAVRLILQSAILGLAVWLAVKHQISPGAIIAGSLLMGRALAPIDQLVGGWSGVVQARAAYERLITLFSDLPEAEERLRLPAPAARLQVSAITVVKSGRPVLQQVSFEANPGELLGVVGPSGAGKSALLAAIAGALDVKAGVIRLDGGDLSDWEPERLGPHLGYLAQDPGLFAGSIRDNVSRFAAELDDDREAIDAQVVQAAKAACAHDMILALAGGYEARLGPGGAGLSAGQTQRIGLARALYGSPKFLLLDEPNAHLDREGEQALMEALRAAKAAGSAIVLAAHRPSVLALADRILVLRAGRVEAYGPASEVMARIAVSPPAPPLRVDGIAT